MSTVISVKTPSTMVSAIYARVLIPEGAAEKLDSLDVKYHSQITNWPEEFFESSIWIWNLIG